MPSRWATALRQLLGTLADKPPQVLDRGRSAPKPGMGERAASLRPVTERNVRFRKRSGRAGDCLLNPGRANQTVYERLKPGGAYVIVDRVREALTGYFPVAAGSAKCLCGDLRRNGVLNGIPGIATGRRGDARK
jgi:hypothetical protein